MLFRDKSGTISQTELEEALRVFGYNLSSQVENYRNDQLTLQLSADTTLPGNELPPWSADIAVISGYDLRSTIICWCCSYQLPGREQPYYHDQLIFDYQLPGREELPWQVDIEIISWFQKAHPIETILTSVLSCLNIATRRTGRYFSNASYVNTSSGLL